MKTHKHPIYFALLIPILLFSCEKSSQVGFSIEFSHDITINEDDVAFYDSSTCILFLKEYMTLPLVEDNRNGKDYPEFSVSVDQETVYNGIIYPMVSMISPSPIFILENEYPVDMIPILFAGLTEPGNDMRNDEFLISYLDSRNLLRNGISCTLDSVTVESFSKSTITCTITLKNNDNSNYYIPDPGKMGGERFELAAGGLQLWNVETGDLFSASTENYQSDWRELKLEDLSLLESNSIKSFTYSIKLSSPIVKGEFNAHYRFGQFFPYGVPLNHEGLNLDQEDGRIWLGGINARVENIVFD